MKHVDLIIKYLSGDMNQEEVGSFEKDLASNPLLKEEFEEVSVAYRLIRDQLQQRDEESFRAKLVEIMEKPAPKIQHKLFGHRPPWYFLLPLAGSLAILLTVFLINQRGDKILSRFFEPDKDPVILAFNQGTRGGSESGILLYHDGHYMESMDKMSELLEKEPENQLALLFYLLAAMELDLQEAVLERVLPLSIHADQRLGQSLNWYTSLALVKSGRMEEASTQLQMLTGQPGPYQNDARRLQKMLLK
ncbi:MAG: hypothetical protein ABFS38_01440 [Bacteroidota bacterium]